MLPQATRSMILPGTYEHCMSGHYYAVVRGDEECPVCKFIADKDHGHEIVRRVLDGIIANQAQELLTKECCTHCGGPATTDKDCYCAGSGKLSDQLKGLYSALEHFKKRSDDHIPSRMCRVCGVHSDAFQWRLSRCPFCEEPG